MTFSISKGQDLVYAQFITNPYIYNPGYAGIEGQPIFTLTHRRQWIGITDAPVTTNLVYSMPFLSGINLGANISQDQAGIFKSTRVLITGGYTIDLGGNHYISFGLSLGGGNSSIDLNEGVNLNDPALSDVLESSAFLDGNFGLYYHFKNLNFGFTLPRLFQTDTYSTVKFDNGSFDALSNFLITLDHMFYFGGDQQALQPFLLYRSNSIIEDQIEAGAIFHVNHVAWLGAEYRQNFGYAAMLGVKIPQQFSVGYAFGIAAENISGVNQTTHEIQLTLLLGLKNARSENYSTFLSSQRASPSQGKGSPNKEINPRFKRGQNY